MRVVHLVAIGLAAATVSLASPLPAAAADLDRDHRAAQPKPAGHVWGTWPGGPDPYEYRYRPVGWYPYYNSDYWVPRAEMRYRYRKPLLIGEYWSSWGYPVRCKDHACRTRAAYRRPTK